MARKHDQRGATLAEYATALAILLPIFAMAGFILERAIKSGTLASRSTVKNMTPQSAELSSLRSSAAIGGDDEMGDPSTSLDNTSYDEH